MDHHYVYVLTSGNNPDRKPDVELVVSGEVRAWRAFRDWAIDYEDSHKPDLDQFRDTLDRDGKISLRDITLFKRVLDP